MGINSSAIPVRTRCWGEPAYPPSFSLMISIVIIHLHSWCQGFILKERYGRIRRGQGLPVITKATIVMENLIE